MSDGYAGQARKAQGRESQLRCLYRKYSQLSEEAGPKAEPSPKNAVARSRAGFAN